jgi:hypothetical protein
MAKISKLPTVVSPVAPQVANKFSLQDRAVLFRGQRAETAPLTSLSFDGFISDQDIRKQVPGYERTTSVFIRVPQDDRGLNWMDVPVPELPGGQDLNAEGDTIRQFHVGLTAEQANLNAIADHHIARGFKGIVDGREVTFWDQRFGDDLVPTTAVEPGLED